MNLVAVVICNWNKREELIACIHSVMQSTFRNFDLFVVDNASTDGSVEAVADLPFPIRIIRNKRNLGGSGGFNAGLRAVMEGPYKYVHLLDNDVILDKQAIEALYMLMEKDAELGLLGSKLYSYREPEHLQEYGSYIDWDKYQVNPLYKGAIDRDDIPELLECDYLPACSAMVRVEAIRKVGLLDEQFFIYWDDIDWGFRVQSHGYRVAVCSCSRVWHKMGAANRATTFPTYYFWRNRIHFFATHLEEFQLDNFAVTLFQEWFQAVFMSQYKGQDSVARTLLHALDDALNGIRGQAPQGRVLEREQIHPFSKADLDNMAKSRIVIEECEELKPLMDAVRLVAGQTNLPIRIQRKFRTEENLLRELAHLGIDVIFDLSPSNEPESEYLIRTCNHILDLRNDLQDIPADLIIDSYSNMVISDQDKAKLAVYDHAFEQGRKLYEPYILRKLKDFKLSPAVRCQVPDF